MNSTVLRDDRQHGPANDIKRDRAASCGATAGAAEARSFVV